MEGCSGSLDPALVEKGGDPGEGVLAGRAAEAALDRLSKQLRNLPQLALKVWQAPSCNRVVSVGVECHCHCGQQRRR